MRGIAERLCFYTKKRGLAFEKSQLGVRKLNPTSILVRSTGIEPAWSYPQDP